MVEPSARVGGLSVGERQRVEIFKALYRYVKILILDEPTAHLPPQEADDLFATLRLATANGLSIPFISHKLHKVIEISDRVTALRYSKLVAQTRTADTDKNPLPALMMGTVAKPPDITLPSPCKALLSNDNVSNPN